MHRSNKGSLVKFCFVRRQKNSISCWLEALMLMHDFNKCVWSQEYSYRRDHMKERETGGYCSYSSKNSNKIMNLQAHLLYSFKISKLMQSPVCHTSNATTEGKYYLVEPDIYAAMIVSRGVVQLVRMPVKGVRRIIWRNNFQACTEHMMIRSKMETGQLYLSFWLKKKGPIAALTTLISSHAIVSILKHFKCPLRWEDISELLTTPLNQSIARMESQLHQDLTLFDWICRKSECKAGFWLNVRPIPFLS